MIELTFAQIFLDKVLIEVADVEHCTEANHPLFRQRKSLNRTAGGQLAVQHDEMIVALPKSTAGFLWKEATHGYQRNYHQFQRIMSHWFPWFWVSPCIPYFLSDKAMRKEPKTSWWWRWFQRSWSQNHPKPGCMVPCRASWPATPFAFPLPWCCTKLGLDSQIRHDQTDQRARAQHGPTKLTPKT